MAAAIEYDGDVPYIEQFQVAANIHKNRYTLDVLTKIKELAEDSDLADEYRDKLITYTSVLKSGRWKLSQYLDAVQFVTCRISGMSQRESYGIVFPEKVAKWEAMGRDSKRIASNITVYSQTELIVALYEQTMIPTHILNAGLFQEALNVAAEIMVNSRSDIARVNAINSILTNTKAPVSTKIEMDVNVKQTDSISSLREATEKLAIAEAQAIEAGMSVKAIAESIIVEAEIEEIE